MAEIRTLGPKVARFLETYCVHPKGARFDEPFELEPWQRDFVDELYRVEPKRDEQGELVTDREGKQVYRRVYRQALLGIPRGNGKTPLAAGIGLFELMSRRDAPDIFNVAGAADQAGLLTEFARAFVDRGPGSKPGKLRTWLTTSAKAVTHKRSRGVMRLLTSAGSLQHGLSVSAAILDELHAFLTQEQVEVFNALWTALHKREDAVLLSITTAGFNKATLLGRMFEDGMALELEERLHVDGVGPCLRIGRDYANRTLFWWYGPPETKPDGEPYTVEDAIANEDVWRAVNPASWVTIPGLREQLGGMGVDELDFARLHLNMWTQARTTFIPAASWKTCYANARRADGELIAPQPKRAIWVAVDVGISHDTSAVAWAQPVTITDKENKPRSAVVNRVRIWSANPEHEHDRNARHIWVPGGRMDLELLEEFILDGLLPSFVVRELVYDKTFFEGEAQRLAKKGVRSAPLYQNNVDPQIAYQRFYQDVKEGRALHPNDRVLNAHIAAMAGQKTERGWKVSVLASAGPIDGGVAVAWAHWRASRQAGSVYEQRGLTVIGDDDEDDDE